MLQYQTVEKATLGLLKSLMQEKYLEQFALVGGTALALHLGHRKSVDLDFFTCQDFEANLLFERLKLKFTTSTPFIKLNQTLTLEIEGIKVDFIRFRYPFIRPVLLVEGIRMLSVDDIAPMKLDALSARGSKKDFYDVFFLLHQFSLSQLLDLYDEKYHHETIFHVIRSLTYFIDAEEDADPFVLDKTITWNTVKQTIEEAVRQLK